jgi:Schlafen, AlbA_2
MEWSDVVEAAAGGLLDESHWVDLKRELPAGKAKSNTELAQDLASLAVDGGMLVIGVEDNNSRAGTVCGAQLDKLADRVDQVARSKVRPPLTVRSTEMPGPDRPGWGCLLVHVPPSAEAPHMVDYVYYGRGDRANIRLSDEQVRAILDGRARTKADVLAELRRMVADDPLPDDVRECGHLYLVAQPEYAGAEALLELLTGADAGRLILESIAAVVRERGEPGFQPDVRDLYGPTPRAEGLAFTSYHPEDGIRTEQVMIELVVREDGGIRLICGRGVYPEVPRFMLPSAGPPRAVHALLVLGLTHAVVALAGRLADEHAGYQGTWRLGLRMDRLRGAVPLDLIAKAPFGRGNPYSRDDYERGTSAATEELVMTPQAVTERLVAPLLRGLGVGPDYLPYRTASQGS